MLTIIKNIFTVLALKVAIFSLCGLNPTAAAMPDIPAFKDLMPLSLASEELVTEESEDLASVEPGGASEVTDKEVLVFYDELETGTIYAKDDEYLSELFDCLNEERAKNGVAPLAWDPNLAIFAGYRTQQIQSNYSHYLPDGTAGISLYDRANGENLLTGPYVPTGRYTVDIFNGSEGHRHCQLNPDYTRVGFAYRYGYDGKFYLACIFGW